MIRVAVLSSRGAALWRPGGLAVLAVGALSGCSILSGQPDPEVPSSPARGDPRLEQARSVARYGLPSPAPYLDDLARLAARTTPRLGLPELVGDNAPHLRAAPSRHRPLRGGDQILVVVGGRPELGGALALDPDGWVEVPHLGMVEAAGRLPEELGEKLAGLLSEGYLERAPAVTVTLPEPSPRAARVVGRLDNGASGEALEGAAMRAERVELPADRPLSLVELLGRVGGLASDADAEHLILMRRVTEVRTVACPCFHFSYRELVAADLRGEQVWVRAGDQLIIPRLPDVFVFGAVRTPGPHSLRRGATVTALLLEAGAAPAQQGGSLLVHADGESPAAPAQVLAPGQVLFVPGTLRVYVVGPGVVRNGGMELPAQGLSVLGALSEAGWLSPTGDPDGVRILRLRRGSRVSLPVPLDEILSGRRSESDFMLQPGDTVHVPQTSW